MGILDQIANPKVPSFLDNLKVMDDIEQRKTNRMLAEVQAGKTLQDIQMQREAMANQQRGTQAIERFLLPQQQTYLSQLGQGQNLNRSAQEEPQITASPPTSQEQVKQQILQPFQNLRTEQLTSAQNLTQLANTLMSIPGNEGRAKQFYDTANLAYQRAIDSTQKEWEQTSTMFEALGNQYDDLAKLEDKNDFKAAQTKFDEIRNFIKQDPRLNQNPDVQQFFTQFDHYQPGIGKYILASTMLGKKARDQYLQERLAYGENIETISMGLYDKTFTQLTIPERQHVLEYQVQTKKPGVQVNLGQGASEFEKQLGGVSAKKFLDERDSAQSAVQGLQGITEARKLIKSGIITGFGANFVVGFGKALRQAGLNVLENDIDNSNAFIAAQAQQVANIIQQFGAGTGLSDADREFATKAAGGDITLTEGSIKKILEINEKAYTNVINLYNQRAEKIPANIVPYDLKVNLPPEYTAQEKPRVGRFIIEEVK